VLWLDHLLRGEPPPFPLKNETKERYDQRFCEFCGKNEKEVQKLIASPGQMCICNECVGVCVKILEDPAKAAEPDSTTALPARWPTR
jgi:hypothetical protein